MLRYVCSDVIPSFVLMSIMDEKVITYVYELRGTEMKVTKSEFVKRGAAGAAAAK